MVHSIPNETMDTWFDTQVGPVCLICFATAYNSGDFDRYDNYKGNE